MIDLHVHTTASDGKFTPSEVVFLAQSHGLAALAITDHINRSMEADMGLFMSLTMLMILLLLAVLFRRVTGTLLPPLVVGLSVLATIGVMVALGIPGTTAVQVLPIFILTVGICDAVHILAIVYQRLDAGDEKDDAIAYAVGHSGLAVLMTSVTTAAGMASFISAEMVMPMVINTRAPSLSPSWPLMNCPMA